MGQHTLKPPNFGKIASICDILFIKALADLLDLPDSRLPAQLEIKAYVFPLAFRQLQQWPKCADAEVYPCWILVLNDIYLTQSANKQLSCMVN